MKDIAQNINKNVLFFLAIALLKIALFFIINGSLTINNDEQETYKIANNITLGKGQVIYSPLCNCDIPTARRGSFNIFIYQVLLQYNIPLNAWVIFYYIGYLILFLISIYCFYKISLHYLSQNEKYARISAIVYGLYPSSLFYIGTFFFYENIAICALVIFYYYFVVNQKKNLAIIPVLLISVFSLLARSHVFPILILLSLVLIFIYRNTCRWKSYSLVIFLLVSVALNYAMMLRNEKYTGVLTLGSQTGTELLQGHNPYARGSWMSFDLMTDTKHPVYQYVKNAAPDVDLNREFEQSALRKKLAINWALTHWKEEIVLTLRKIAIFFLPQNFESLKSSTWYNPVNLIIHILFLAFCFLMLAKRKLLTADNIMLIIPMLACLGFSILFFVGYRWRYYCEPFMILGAIYFIQKMREPVSDSK